MDISLINSQAPLEEIRSPKVDSHLRHLKTHVSEPKGKQEAIVTDL